MNIETKESYFSTSLLLANSPMSPKVVNGSFIAVADEKDLPSGVPTRWAIIRNHVLEKQGTIYRPYSIALTRAVRSVNVLVLQVLCFSAL